MRISVGTLGEAKPVLVGETKPDDVYLYAYRNSVSQMLPALPEGPHPHLAKCDLVRVKVGRYRKHLRQGVHPKDWEWVLTPLDTLGEWEQYDTFLYDAEKARWVPEPHNMNEGVGLSSDPREVLQKLRQKQSHNAEQISVLESQIKQK